MQANNQQERSGFGVLWRPTNKLSARTGRSVDAMRTDVQEVVLHAVGALHHLIQHCFRQ